MGGGDIQDAYAVEVEMTPDDAGGVNTEWSESTPSGVCRLVITNKASFANFPLGASMKVMFEQTS